MLLGHMGGPFWARKDEAAWSIPKGEYEPDENPAAAAAREFTEELGSPPPPGELVELGTVRQSGGKQVTAFALRGDLDADRIVSNVFTLEWPPRSGRMQEFPEIDRAAWFDVSTARAKIVRGQLPFLDRLLALGDPASGRGGVPHGLCSAHTDAAALAGLALRTPTQQLPPPLCAHRRSSGQRRRSRARRASTRLRSPSSTAPAASRSVDGPFAVAGGSWPEAAASTAVANCSKSLRLTSPASALPNWAIRPERKRSASARSTVPPSGRGLGPQADVGLGRAAAGVGALADEVQEVRVGVALHHLREALERQLHRAQRHAGAAAVPVVLERLEQLGAGQAAGEPVEVREHLPHVVHRRGQGARHLDRRRRGTPRGLDLRRRGEADLVRVVRNRLGRAAPASDEGPGRAVHRRREAVGVLGRDVGDGGEDAAVPRAAAEHAGHLLGEVGGVHGGAVGAVGQQVVGAEQHPRRAEPALEPVVCGERPLQRVLVGSRAETLDGDDLRTVALHGEEQARAGRDTVHEDRAHAAHPVLAAEVGAGQPEVLAQRVGEVHPGGHPHGDLAAVDGEPDLGQLVRRHPLPGPLPPPSSALWMQNVVRLGAGSA